MSNPAPSPAGWYPDPWDARAQRYWDGTQWTQHTAPGAVPGAAPVSYGAARPQRARVVDGAPVYGPFIWVLALLPLVNAISIWFVHVDVNVLVEFSRQAQDFENRGEIGPFPVLDVWQLLGPGYVVTMILTLLAWAAGIVFAALDGARLKAVGVERPFHWAWAFLTPIVYVIGRSVIVRRVAAPRGLVPIWVLLAAYAATIVSSSIWSAIVSNDLLSQLNTIVSNT